MNSYNNQRQNQYQGYASQSPDPIDLQQYERQQFYQAPQASPDPVLMDQSYSAQQQVYMPQSGQQANYAGFNPADLGGSGSAGLCYIGFWLAGLLFIIFGNRKRLVRFHAMQSLLFFGSYTILQIFLIRLIDIRVFFLSDFAIFALVMINIIMFVGWLVGMISAFQGKYTKLPFVGDFAERFANGDGLLK